MLGRFMAGKFRNPTGFFGRMAGNMMARGNETEVKWTVELLNIQPGDQVLEVGFGPGVGIRYAAQKATQGLVAGLDYSDTMVKVASKRNADAVKAGRVALRQGDVAALPYLEGAFDKAYAIHCIYFWTQPKDGLTELRRVLKPGGRLAITIMPEDKWPPGRRPPADLFTLYSGSEVAQMLSEVGFLDVRVEAGPELDKFPGVSVLGTK
jgi:ubiquinone/menaquinone biosynthesis C-methylase UbiE